MGYSKKFYINLYKAYEDELKTMAMDFNLPTPALVQSAWDLPINTRSKIYEIVSNLNSLAKEIEEFERFDKEIKKPITAKEAVQSGRLRVVK